MAELTRNGVVGLELTREEVAELQYKVDALGRKAQCREVNQDVIELLSDVSRKLYDVDTLITDILEGNY